VAELIVAKTTDVFYEPIFVREKLVPRGRKEPGHGISVKEKAKGRES
jgi:hypothetical protein